MVFTNKGSNTVHGFNACQKPPLTPDLLAMSIHAFQDWDDSGITSPYRGIMICIPIDHERKLKQDIEIVTGVHSNIHN